MGAAFRYLVASNFYLDHSVLYILLVYVLLINLSLPK